MRVWLEPGPEEDRPAIFLGSRTYIEPSKNEVWMMCSPGNHPSQVHAYIQTTVFGPKSGLICKHASCVWCVLDVSSVFLSDPRVVRSHGVVSRGSGRTKTAQVRLRKDGLGVSSVVIGKVPAAPTMPCGAGSSIQWPWTLPGARGTV